MSPAEITQIRLMNQQIAASNFQSAKDLAAWMGAMQAQDYPMLKWALGVRLPKSKDKAIEAAMDRGEVLRTHLLRPTWHLVSSDDIYWILELTAPQIKKAMNSRHKELELHEAAVSKCNKVITNALARGEHLTREDLMQLLEQSQISVRENNRAAHIFALAELDGLICSGKAKGNKQTYALLEERVPKKTLLSKEEALGKLAKQYFLSHGPATLQDFGWWSGLTISDARNALEMVKSNFISETIDSQIYWFSDSIRIPKMDEPSVFLLPAFDEYFISYKDRRAILPFEHHTKTVSNNGVFRPMILFNGQIMGIWKRMVKKEQVLIEFNFFQSPDENTMELIERAALEFGDFLDKKVHLK
ncbi:MAG: winged helix DNA-binding domain-containing protein [Saprospiraceae bacterium]|nr:winged helix DNA-binding domain-containing protein [Saprospiraceae bacterium]